MLRTSVFARWRAPICLAALAIALNGCVPSPAATPIPARGVPPTSTLNLAPAAARLATAQPTTAQATPVPAAAAVAAGAPARSELRGTNPGAVEPAPTALPMQPVVLAEAGLAFNVPHTWTRVGDGWVWQPPAPGGLRIGLKWQDIQPGQEVEAVLLPKHAVMQDATQLELPWATRTMSYTLEVFPATGSGGQPGTIETHVIAWVGKRAYDFYAVGGDTLELANLNPILRKVLASVQVVG